MLFKAVIVLGALVACQGTTLTPRNAEEVRQTIDLFRDLSIAEIRKGFEKLNVVIGEINDSSAAAEEKGHKLVNETVQMAYKQINETQEEAKRKVVDISECTKTTSDELPKLLERFNKMIKDCGSNNRHEVNVLVNETMESTGREAYYRRHFYYTELRRYFEQKNETLLNDIFAAVKDDIKVYPENLQKQFDQTLNSINAIENEMVKCFQNIENELPNEYNMKMSECIKSGK